MASAVAATGIGFLLRAAVRMWLRRTQRRGLSDVPPE
jgi:hypothetical protein